MFVKSRSCVGGWITAGSAVRWPRTMFGQATNRSARIWRRPATTERFRDSESFRRKPPIDLCSISERAHSLQAVDSTLVDCYWGLSGVRFANRKHLVLQNGLLISRKSLRLRVRRLPAGFLQDHSCSPRISTLHCGPRLGKIFFSQVWQHKSCPCYAA